MGCWVVFLGGGGEGRGGGFVIELKICGQASHPQNPLVRWNFWEPGPCVYCYCLCLTFFILIGQICSSSIKVKKNWSSFAICCWLNPWETDMKSELGPYSSGKNKNYDVSPRNPFPSPVVLSALVTEFLLAGGDTSYITFLFSFWKCA